MPATHVRTVRMERPPSGFRQSLRKRDKLCPRSRSRFRYRFCASAQHVRSNTNGMRPRAWIYSTNRSRSRPHKIPRKSPYKGRHKGPNTGHGNSSQTRPPRRETRHHSRVRRVASIKHAKTKQFLHAGTIAHSTKKRKKQFLHAGTIAHSTKKRKKHRKRQQNKSGIWNHFSRNAYKYIGGLALATAYSQKEKIKNAAFEAATDAGAHIVNGILAKVANPLLTAFISASS